MAEGGRIEPGGHRSAAVLNGVPGPARDLGAVRIRRSAPAVAARAASAELHAFLDATPLGDPEDPAVAWLAQYAALSGRLDSAMTGLLAEIDAAAGGGL